jgi:hypothetical protein
MVKQKTFLRIFSASIIAVTVIMPLFSLGCNNQPEEISAELGHEFELKLGQTAAIEDEPIKIKLVEVVGDSRCPTGASCIWQGEVKCVLEITYLGELHAITITQPGLTQQNSTDVFQDYMISYNVTPYPEVFKEIQADEYRLLLTIDKTPLLSGGILVTFFVEGEEYKIFVENKETIEDIFAVERGESQATIPSGKIIGEPVFYNAPWSWHIDPMDIQMAEFTIEVCSGLPSHVENDLDYWVNTVGRFCPWSAEIVEIRDFR